MGHASSTVTLLIAFGQQKGLEDVAHDCEKSGLAFVSLQVVIRVTSSLYILGSRLTPNKWCTIWGVPCVLYGVPFVLYGVPFVSKLCK